MSSSPIVHRSVMIDEVLAGLAVHDGGKYIDCTLGDGGHAQAILCSVSDSRILGIDADPEAVGVARGRLERFGDRASLVNGNFRSLKSVASQAGFIPSHGILFDLGVSSRQLDVESRGFTFRRPGALDMRFSPDAEVSAFDIVNSYSEENLANVIYQYGEERRSRRIAKAIVAGRPLTDSQQLADLVRRSSGYPRGRTHPATRTFQAIRIAVNDEIEALRSALEQARDVLAEGGRLVTLSYHSLEDRVIKRFITDGDLTSLAKRVIRPSKEEVSNNPRSRSAKLRIAERWSA